MTRWCGFRILDRRSGRKEPLIHHGGDSGPLHDKKWDRLNNKLVFATPSDYNRLELAIHGQAATDHDWR